MVGSDTASILWYLAVLVLVGSSLLSRRVPLRSAVGMILLWIGIFTIALTIFSYREELGSAALRVQSEILGEPQQFADGGTLRIRMAPDGHYWINGEINGKPARFLVDSGATITALSSAMADAASLEMDTQRAPLILETANGQVEAQRAVVRRMTIGSISIQDLPVVISPAFGGVNVIGMNLLSRLKSWRVEGREMILEP